MFKANRETWNQLRSRKTYLQVLLYFILITIGVLTLSTLIMYTLFSRSSLKQIANQVGTILQEKADKISFTMDTTLTSALRTSRDPDIYLYAAQDIDDQLQAYQAWGKMMDIVQTNQIVDSVYLLNGNTKSVLSTYSGNSTWDDFYDKGIIDLLDKWDITEQMKEIPRELNATIKSRDYKANLYSIIIPYEMKKPLSAFVLNINLDKLHMLLGEQIKTPEFDIFLTNSHNVILSSSKSDKFLSTISQYSKVDKIKETVNGSFNAKVDGVDSLVAYSKLAFKNWEIYHIIPHKNIFSEVRKLRNLTLIIYFFIFLITLIIIWRISYKIYSPIETLVSDVNNRFNQLFKIWRSHLGSTRESLLKEMVLSPSYSLQTATNLFKEYNFTITPHSLVIVVFRLDNYKVFTVNNSSYEQKLLRYALTNIIKETLGKDLAVETADMGKDHVIAVCNVDSEEDIDRLIPQMEKCQHNISTYLTLSVTAAIGPYLELHKDLPEGYKQTLELTSERLKYGIGQIFSSGSQVFSMQTDYVYPENTEKKLLNSLKLEHYEETIGHLDDFIELIKCYSRPEIYLAITQFLLSLDKTFKQMRLDFSKDFSDPFTDITDRMEMLETLNAFRGWMISILDHVVAALNQQSYGRNADVATEIIHIIESHLSDPNLSSKLISDQLNLSTNYVRTLFKDEVGYSISECIKNKRLNKVKDLLQTTDLSIDKICLMAGFPAVNSFYNMFKKETGLTPAQFRKA